jgi:hypothetical protein
VINLKTLVKFEGNSNLKNIAKNGYMGGFNGANDYIL